MNANKNITFRRTKYVSNNASISTGEKTTGLPCLRMFSSWKKVLALFVFTGSRISEISVGLSIFKNRVTPDRIYSGVRRFVFHHRRHAVSCSYLCTVCCFRKTRPLPAREREGPMSLVNRIRVEFADPDLKKRVSRFLDSRHFPALRNIDIDVRHGEVTLSGRVCSYYEKQVAITSCQRVAGVLEIVDEIIVTDIPADDRVEQAVDVVQPVDGVFDSGGFACND